MSVSPRRPSLPPLNALRAFEAAARCGGFARAAEELNVTPAAVAGHVKLLEAWAGAPLFRRTPRGVILTASGADVAEILGAAFDTLGQAARRLRALDRTRVHVAALPAVAQMWLGPRLPDLNERWPELEISVTAMETAPNLEREAFDLALFFADSPEAASGEVAQVLARDSLIPVASPALAAELATPEDLLQARIITDSSWSGDWAIWAASAGLDRVPAGGPLFSLYALAVEAALAGGGVLMGHRLLVAGYLDTGALVPCPGPEVPLDSWLHMWRANGAGEAAVGLFRALGADAAGLPAVR